MHGIRKIKTSEEAKAARREKEKAKIKDYQVLVSSVMTRYRQEDYSKDALLQTTTLLNANPEFYTIWNYRRKIILAEKTNDDDLKTNLSRELQFTVGLLKSHPKCYWIWNHRSWALETIPSPDWKLEFGLTSRMLELDPRNFHGWNYRRYVVAQMEKTSGISHVKHEFDFTTEKINSNFSNFSAWHNRTKLLQRMMVEKSMSEVERQKALETEFELIKNAIYTEPNDQSGWLYHRWLVGRQMKPISVLGMYLVEGVIYVVFDTRVRLNSVFTIQVNEKDFPTLCRAPKGVQSYSYVWLIYPNHLSVKEGDVIRVFITDVISSTPLARLFSPVKWILKVSSVVGMSWMGFSNEFTETKDDARKVYQLADQDSLQQQTFSYDERVNLIERELDVFTELLDLEPNSKWILQSVGYFLDELGFLYNEESKRSEIKNKIDPIINKLSKLDLFRLGYIQDWKSREAFTLDFEHLIKKHRDSMTYKHSDEVEKYEIVHAKHLTFIPCVGAYINPQIETLDASNQCLGSMNFINEMVFMKKINLNNNEISKVVLPDNFESISLRSNKVSDIEVVKQVCMEYTGKSLFLDLSDNPLLSSPNSLMHIGNVIVQF